MIEINPYELDPEEARNQFFDYQKRIFNKLLDEMYDVQDDISYIVQHYDHSYDFSDVDCEVITYLEKHGLLIKPTEACKGNKANPDYYLAIYFCLETAEYFFKNFKNMGFDCQLSNLSYAKKQFAIVEALSPTGEPKHKIRNTKGQSKGANISNENRYKLTRQKAYIEWDKYKRTVAEWGNLKSTDDQYEKQINVILKEFEKSFFNLLTGMRLKGANTETQNLLDEKYTDSTQNPPLVIGWIKEVEGISNSQKEQANKKRKERERRKLLESNPYYKFSVRVRKNI